MWRAVRRRRRIPVASSCPLSREYKVCMCAKKKLEKMGECVG